jgi:hypothetical protein
VIQIVSGAQVARDPLEQHFRRTIDETGHLCGQQMSGEGQCFRKSLRANGMDADALSKRMPDLTLADLRAADPLGRAPVIGPIMSSRLKKRAARTVARMAKP